MRAKYRKYMVAIALVVVAFILTLILLYQRNTIIFLIDNNILYLPILKIYTYRNTDVNASIHFDSIHGTILHYAVFSMNTRGLLNIIKMGANINYGTIGDNYTPLHMACIIGWYDGVKYLIDNGASIAAIDSYGNTPIYYAAMNSHSDIVEYLSPMNNDQNSKNNMDKIFEAIALGWINSHNISNDFSVSLKNIDVSGSIIERVKSINKDNIITNKIPSINRVGNMYRKMYICINKWNSQTEVEISTRIVDSKLRALGYVGKANMYYEKWYFRKESQTIIE